MPNTDQLSMMDIKGFTRLEAMGDHGIDLSEMPEVTEWSGAVRGAYLRQTKMPLSVWLDADIVTWLKGLGPGYEARMNSVLRDDMNQRLRQAEAKSRRSATAP